MSRSLLVVLVAVAACTTPAGPDWIPIGTDLAEPVSEGTRAEADPVTQAAFDAACRELERRRVAWLRLHYKSKTWSPGDPDFAAVDSAQRAYDELWDEIARVFSQSNVR